MTHCPLGLTQTQQEEQKKQMLAVLALNEGLEKQIEAFLRALQ